MQLSLEPPGVSLDHDNCSGKHSAIICKRSQSVLGTYYSFLSPQEKKKQNETAGSINNNLKENKWVNTF